MLGGIEVGESGDSSSKDHRHWQVGMVEGVQGLACRYGARERRGDKNQTLHPSEVHVVTTTILIVVATTE